MSCGPETAEADNKARSNGGSGICMGKARKPVDIYNANFRNWFGNSRVVDKNGEPLVVYKAMYPYDWETESEENPRGKEITSINRSSPFPAFNGDEPGIKVAGFFGDIATANRFGDICRSSAIYPVYLSFQNPYIIDAKGERAGNIQFGKSGKPFRDAVRSGKYDSVIIKNTSDEGTIYIALRPEQVKSVFNRGDFDPNNPNMLD